MRRKPGISTLLACQNEELSVEHSIRSFLDFSDEIVVVDNGSTDRTIEICREMESRFPMKVRFHNAPHLKDLYENRQYALERSHYQWIVRADADFICYTDGEYDARRLREHLLSGWTPPYPISYTVCFANLYGDFWHSGQDPDGVTIQDHPSRSPGKVFPIVARGGPRIYRWVSGMRFDRLGRWEGLRLGPIAKRLQRIVDWPTPIWIHCNVKPARHYLMRFERTNWRELGDYDRFPTLASFVAPRVREKYGTDSLSEAESICMNRHVLPYLAPYDADRYYPYPTLLRDLMNAPAYRIHSNPAGAMVRDTL